MAITIQFQREDEEQTSKEQEEILKTIAEDLGKIKAEHKKGPASFLRYLNDKYVPLEKKLELTEEMLSET